MKIDLPFTAFYSQFYSADTITLGPTVGARAAYRLYAGWLAEGCGNCANISVASAIEYDPER